MQMEGLYIDFFKLRRSRFEQIDIILIERNIRMFIDGYLFLWSIVSEWVFEKQKNQRVGHLLLIHLVDDLLTQVVEDVANDDVVTSSAIGPRHFSSDTSRTSSDDNCFVRWSHRRKS